MKTLKISLVMLVALCCQAQQKPPSAEPPPEIKIKAYTKLVQIPVIVKDHKGQPVLNLTKEDFMVKENGKDRAIATFEAVTTSTAPILQNKLPLGVYSNILMGQQGQRSITIIMIDAVNTPFMDQVYGRQQLIKYLKEKLQPGGLLSLMVLTKGGIRVIHESTTDPEVLIAALKRVKTGSVSPGTDEVAAMTNTSVDPQVQVEADALNDISTNAEETYAAFQRGMAVDATLNAMEYVAQTYAGVPGRKSLLWVTSGFPFTFDDSKSYSSSFFTDRLSRVFQSLNDSNVSVYPVDVRGLVVFGPTASTPSNMLPVRNPRALASTMSMQSRNFQNTLDSLRTMAQMTGGVAYYNTNDLTGAFQKASADSAAYYMLGYYLHDEPDTKPGWRKLSVKVNRGGVDVRSRSGFFITPQTTDPDVNKMADLRLAQRSVVPFTKIPLVVKWQPDLTKASVPAEFVVQINTGEIELSGPENYMNLELIAVANSNDGRVLDSVRKNIDGNVKKVEELRRQPLVYTGHLRISKDLQSARFIVRDNVSGKMGSVLVEQPHTN